MTWDTLNQKFTNYKEKWIKIWKKRNGLNELSKEIYKKDKIGLEINNKLKDTQSRKESNPLLIKGIKKARKSRKPSDINKSKWSERKE